MSDATEAAAHAPPAPSVVGDVAELVKRLCVSVSNALMYAPDHPVVRDSIDKTTEWLERMLKDRKRPLVISMGEGRVFFERLTLDQRNPMVARLARQLEAVHAHNLSFQPGLSGREVLAFHELLARSPDDINAGGGIARLMTEAGISGIRTRDSRYVLLTDEEKVVRSDTKVTDLNPATPARVEKEVARYLAGAVLREAREKSWLINEIKHNPHRLSRSILEGVETAVARAEEGQDPDAKGLETLLENVKLIGERLLQADEDDPEAIELGEALAHVEGEFRSRSGHLTSCKVARGFVDQIMGLLATLSQQARARGSAGEMVKGERGLRQAEAILSRIASGDDRSKEEKPAAETEQDHAAPDPSLIKAARAPEHAPKQTTYELDDGGGIEAVLETFGPSADPDLERDPKVQALLEARIREQRAEWEEQTRRLEEKCRRREAFFNSPAMGVVIWDDQGEVEFMNGAARSILTKAGGASLTSDFIRASFQGPIPPESVPLPLRVANARTDAERAFLKALLRSVRDDAGRAVGAILSGS